MSKVNNGGEIVSPDRGPQYRAPATDFSIPRRLFQFRTNPAQPHEPPLQPVK